MKTFRMLALLISAFGCVALVQAEPISITDADCPSQILDIQGGSLVCVDNTPPPPPADSDGDGVPDDIDQCRDEAGPASNGGCPLDDDGDGIPNGQDQCPDEAGPVDNGGCPALPPPPPPTGAPCTVLAQIDTDNDGVGDVDPDFLVPIWGDIFPYGFEVTFCGARDRLWINNGIDYSSIPHGFNYVDNTNQNGWSTCVDAAMTERWDDLYPDGVISMRTQNQIYHNASVIPVLRVERGHRIRWEDTVNGSVGELECIDCVDFEFNGVCINPSQ